MGERPASSAAEVRIERTRDLTAVRALGASSGLEAGERDDAAVIVAWGAFAGDRLVGCIALERHARYVTVNQMAVHDDHRRCGLATRLLATLEEEARGRGVLRLWVQARAPGFFVSRGYVPAPAADADWLLADCRRCEQYDSGCSPRALVKDLVPRPQGAAPLSGALPSGAPSSTASLSDATTMTDVDLNDGAMT